jgi:predicted helicase
MLRYLRKAFAEILIPDLEEPEKVGEFADMFAQTLAYGLFAARCNHRGPGRFQRLGAAAEIPKTNPFLRQLFEIITGNALDEEPFAGFVDDLVQILAHSDIAAILADFGKRTRREDPIVHFYETFLAAYDPKMREMRGVYYTPEPVVSYIVRSVDYLLKTRFNCPGGLADRSMIEYERDADDGKVIKKVKDKAPRVLVLDPACGTGTFLYTVVDHIREEFIKSGNAGMWSGFVKEHLLPRLFGFELLMAPYAVAHFKLGMQLAGQDLPEN